MNRIVLFVSLLLSLAFTSFGQEESVVRDPAMDKLAATAAKSIEKAPLKKKPPRALVWICGKPTGPVNQYAVTFAEQFAHSLYAALEANPKFARPVKVDFFTVGDVEHAADLQSDFNATQFARSKGYNLLILGTCDEAGIKIRTHLRIIDIAARRELASLKAELLTTSEIRKQLRQRISFGTQGEAGESPIYLAGRDGVSTPSCQHCPKPEFPRSALQSEGVVLLRLMVSPAGRAERITFLKRLHPDIDDASVAAVRQWKFKPATKAGKPVAVWTTIEVNFRQY